MPESVFIPYWVLNTVLGVGGKRENQWPQLSLRSSYYRRNQTYKQIITVSIIIIWLYIYIYTHTHTHTHTHTILSRQEDFFCLLQKRISSRSWLWSQHLAHCFAQRKYLKDMLTWWNQTCRIGLLISGVKSSSQDSVNSLSNGASESLTQGANDFITFLGGICCYTRDTVFFAKAVELT